VERTGSEDTEFRGDPPVVALVQDVTNNSKARKLGESFPRGRSGFFSIIEFFQKNLAKYGNILALSGQSIPVLDP